MSTHAHIAPGAAAGPAVNSLGFAKPAAQTRVVVAMSGGVDSSVTAAVLARQGYDVIGVTLQLYDHGAAVKKKGACCAGQDIHDARNVAARLGIPHYVLDYEKRFRDAVMADFAASYAAGETPIPCVRCNERVKFRDMLDTARDLGADCLATGHYIRRVAGPNGPELHRAVDAARDQSYFLFTTTREQLDFLRFPLGDLPKRETRALAEEFALPVAAKPDSQDICFVPQGSYARVVERLRPGAAEPGDIVHLDGRILGRHEGIVHYTIGQRRGLGIAEGEPLFVVALDAARRRVVVGPREALLTREITLREVNWLGEGDLATAGGLRVAVKVRSTSDPVPATVHVDADDGGAGPAVRVTLDEGEQGISPGQACVFYGLEPASVAGHTVRHSRVLGGGWIARGTVPASS